MNRRSGQTAVLPWEQEVTRTTPWQAAAVAVGGGAVGDGRTLEGYAAVFNSPAQIDDRSGRYTEVILPGAFTRSLAELTPVLLFEHGKHPLFGSLPIGTIGVAEQDERGLYVSARLLDTWLVDPVRAAVAAGAVNGMSIRFHVIKDRWSKDPGGGERRTVQEAEVSELGPVVFPAYSKTSVAVRSPARPRDADTQALVARGIIPPRGGRTADRGLLYDELVGRSYAEIVRAQSSVECPQ